MPMGLLIPKKEDAISVFLNQPFVHGDGFCRGRVRGCGCGFYWYWCHYLHTLKSFVLSHICRICCVIKVLGVSKDSADIIILLLYLFSQSQLGVLLGEKLVSEILIRRIRCQHSMFYLNKPWKDSLVIPNISSEDWRDTVVTTLKGRL